MKKIIVLMALFIVSTSTYAQEKILIGSLDMGAPTEISLRKNQSNQVYVYAEYVYEWDEDTDEQSVEKIIPEFNLSGKRDIFYKGEFIGKVQSMFRGDYIVDGRISFSTEKEEYCSRYFNGNDCIATAYRFNIYMTVE